MPPRNSSASTSRADYIRRIENALGHRKLYWFGPRGADASALLDIGQFDGAFSIMAPLEAVSVRHDVSLEAMTGQRVDHNTYSFEADTSDALREFRSKLLSVLSHQSAIVPYRPNRFLSNICFPRVEKTQHLGMFHEHQSQFEHKPWVESELRRIGVNTLPWVYFADEDHPRLVEFFEGNGPIVLRASRSDGGVRVELIETLEQLAHHIPQHDDGFLSACRYLDDSIPLNLNGCIFKDGSVILHGLSEQLIGRSELTRRRFGYCGNVFRNGCDWQAELIDQFERNALLTGKWLAANGYVGVFGVDGLFADGTVYVVEINPRFQGSSWAVALMDRGNDMSDLYLFQLAASLGLAGPPQVPLAETVHRYRDSALAIVCNLSGASARLSPTVASAALPQAQVDLLPRQNVDVHSEAIAARVFLDNCRSIDSLGARELFSTLRGSPLQKSLF